MTTSYLQRPGGKLAYDVTGEGPLVVCVPGMGDLRQTYRFLAPQLVAAGYRVATFDLRGHGESDTTFDSYDDEALATDVQALVGELGGPAVVVGNSMGASAALITAAARPELVSKLVLLGCFARNPQASKIALALMRVATMAPWGAMTWGSYLPKLYAGAKPADFADYKKQVVAAIKRPGYGKGFAQTTHTTHDPAEAALPGVKAPALVVMGENDPDFPDPKAEAAWISERIGSQTVMVADCGHYPQSQQPGVTGRAILDFLAGGAGKPAVA